MRYNKELIDQLINSGITLDAKHAAFIEDYIHSKQTTVGNRYYEDARAKSAIRTGIPS